VTFSKHARFAVAALALSSASAAAPPPAERVVSINVCGDLLALALAPRSHIASLSFLASDPAVSPLVAEARGIPTNRGRAEEVLAFDPDLVLAGRHTTRSTVALLERLGYRVLVLDVADSLDEARGQIATVAAALGVEERGRAMIAALDERVAAAAPAPGSRRPLAVLYRPNGFTAGPGSLPGSLMHAAGFDNLAARAGIRHWGILPLEVLLLARPQVLVFDGAADAAPAVAAQVLEHPALHRARLHMAVARIPGTLWGCPGPWLGEALERLAATRDALPPAVPGNR
jgi:iron complex transport system substrate-binding protein